MADGLFSRMRRSTTGVADAEADPRTGLFTWPSFPPAGYLGQLDDAFQQGLSERLGDVPQSACDFYHSVVLGSGEVVDGAWDLRGGEREYLGETDFSGKRVLELGPASGYLTFHMEESGAEVVGVEAGFDLSIDIIPAPGRDLPRERESAMAAVTRVHRSWWYTHRRRSSAAKVVYANIYDLPADLGEFDIAVFGAILLHLRNPFGALEQAARRTRDRIVVADLWPPGDADPESNVATFIPWGPGNHTHWWYFTPGAIRHMLEILGFGNARILEHTQRHHIRDELTSEAIDERMFTVVADRG